MWSPQLSLWWFWVCLGWNNAIPTLTGPQHPSATGATSAMPTACALPSQLDLRSVRTAGGNWFGQREYHDLKLPLWLCHRLASQGYTPNQETVYFLSQETCYEKVSESLAAGLICPSSSPVGAGLGLWGPRPAYHLDTICRLTARWSGPTKTWILCIQAHICCAHWVLPSKFIYSKISHFCLLFPRTLTVWQLHSLMLLWLHVG